METDAFVDTRGYFTESYNRRTFAKFGINMDFVQDNHSQSTRGVLRGLHFQAPPYAQTKLVRVIAGRILDVVVDLRRKQPTFGKHYAIVLSSENMLQLLVPKGFAHGFVVLSDKAEVIYKCDEYYNPAADGGIYFGDADLAINWKFSSSELVISDKDKALPRLKDLRADFV